MHALNAARKYARDELKRHNGKIYFSKQLGIVVVFVPLCSKVDLDRARTFMVATALTHPNDDFLLSTGINVVLDIVASNSIYIRKPENAGFNEWAMITTYNMGATWVPKTQDDCAGECVDFVREFHF